jgi:hypothetical protein
MDPPGLLQLPTGQASRRPGKSKRRPDGTKVMRGRSALTPLRTCEAYSGHGWRYQHQTVVNQKGASAGGNTAGLKFFGINQENGLLLQDYGAHHPFQAHFPPLAVPIFHKFINT